jgi:hypothetical protein
MFNSRYRFQLCLISSFGISLTSYLLYNYFFHTKILIKEEKKEKQIEPYENKYYDKFNTLHVFELEEEYVKGLKNNIIVENTPKGNIIMYYDFEKESFVYYCDTKDINYLYLETVARKYAINNNCKKLVVDIKKELENAKKETPKTKQVPVSKNTSEVFASFKGYNRKGTGGSKTIKNKFILCQNANRYTYNGKIKDYNILQTNKYTTIKDEPNFTFNEFLAMQRIANAIN